MKKLNQYYTNAWHTRNLYFMGNWVQNPCLLIAFTHYHGNGTYNHVTVLIVSTVVSTNRIVAAAKNTNFAMFIFTALNVIGCEACLSR